MKLSGIEMLGTYPMSGIHETVPVLKYLTYPMLGIHETVR